ncbi:uncharacterized protein BDR25DRAFT_343794 [Lindgomyces ingoldianus]|uniref:Uncharacterized protein n=1 Tax=Lindgomyces ingoldianus TaxID=673940 RepID=A0ACB6QTG1_9PLEO|nr:uncharacterized protein BDR25DRAFT_343794 [Lindgomyces ingoldianus]KAF2469446.1 hypothetical protein BDR25DRAFT_343794 [Lindgomyces ingoldianus]
MANYPQPPYGLPFHVPGTPQQLQHPVPAGQLNTQGSGPRQTPAAEGFLYNGSLAGFNMQSHAQNAQQPPYQYWPPQTYQTQNAYAAVPFPPPFIGQNGIPIPPPPPNYYPSLPQAQPPVQNAPASAPPMFPTLPAHLAPTPVQMKPVINERIAEVAESDKEDGEVSDGDRMSQSPATNGRIHPPPPRSVPQMSQDISMAEDSVGRNQLLSTLISSTQSRDQASAGPVGVNQQLAQVNESDVLEQKREEARKFIKLLHENNIGYASLAKEGLDAPLLSALYRQLNLPFSQEFPSVKDTGGPIGIASSAPNGYSTSTEVNKANGQATVTKSTTALKTTVASSAPAKSAPSPIDRKDYIARLQAAKMGKQPVVAKVTSLQQTPPASEPTASEPTATTMTPQAAHAAGIPKLQGKTLPKDPLQGDERARKTELIRQKLEAMKAKQPAANSTSSQLSKSSSSSLTPKATSFSSPARKVEQAQLGSSTPVQTSPGPRSLHNPSPRVPMFTGIPGLFMNSSSPASNTTQPQPLHNTPVANASETTVSLSRRKRPVASDFDEIPTPRGVGPTYTRPLGQSPHEHDNEAMIIEVSDDESGSSDMDIDDDQAAPKSTAIPSPLTSSRNGPHMLRNLPPLSDFPSRSTSVRPASVVSTPPAVQTPASLAHKDELSKKERDIAILKQKIEALNQRKLAAEARKKDTAMSSPAPQNAETSTVPKPSLSQVSLGSLPPALAASVKVNDPSEPDNPLANPNSANLALSIDWKKQRRAEIESGLPSLEAGLASNKARMAQLLKEMEELEANNRKVLQDKEKLIQELESLGVDTEGMPHAELQAKKDEIDQQNIIQSALQANELNPLDESQSQPFEPSSSSQINGAATQSSTPPELSATQPNGEAELSGNTTSKASEVKLLPNRNGPLEAAFTFDLPQDATHSPLSKTLHAESPVSEDMVMSESESQRVEGADLVAKVEGEAPVEEQEHHASQLASGLSSAGLKTLVDIASPLDDSEDFYSPEPPIIPAANNQPGQIQLVQDPTNDTAILSEEGEAEMSESPSIQDEEEYEPAEPLIPDPANAERENYEVEISSSPASSLSSSPMSSSEEEGEYEPPDLDQELPNLNGDATDQATAANFDLPGDNDDNDAMDITTSSDGESDPAQRNSLQNKSISYNGVGSSAIADDLAPELPSLLLPDQRTSMAEATSTSDDPAEPARFVPYESALRMFKSYRYHPSYSQDVAGGFLSMTYSHQIDKDKPLCQFEAVGGTCNDPHCDGQHFRDMSISGDKILVQLGTANPGKTPEEKQRWNDGLRLVLKELRQRNIKDPNVVAEEIAKYRRQFLHDDTRVVNF